MICYFQQNFPWIEFWPCNYFSWHYWPWCLQLLKSWPFCSSKCLGPLHQWISCLKIDKLHGWFEYQPPPRTEILPLEHHWLPILFSSPNVLYDLLEHCQKVPSPEDHKYNFVKNYVKTFVPIDYSVKWFHEIFSQVGVSNEYCRKWIINEMKNWKLAISNYRIEFKVWLTCFLQWQFFTQLRRSEVPK